LKIKARDEAKTKKRINNEWSKIEEMRIIKKVSKEEVEAIREERTKKEDKLGESNSKEKIFLL